MWHKLLKLLGIKKCPGCLTSTDDVKKTAKAKKK